MTPTRGRTVAAAGIALLAAVALLGPRPRVDASHAGEPAVPEGDLDAWLRASEASVPGLRPGEAKSVTWAGARGAATDVALVYLHGFSADRHELDPVPGDVARALGANLYHARLTGHGRDGPAMAEAEAGDWLRDVGEAIAVGRRLGTHVVLMGTSTGGTLATWAGTRARWADDLLALVLVSPNYGLRDRRARMLLWPWGASIVPLVVGRERCFETVGPEHARHWTTCYPTRALAPMVALTEHVRAIEPEDVRVPALVLYSPKDEIVDPHETERLFAGFASFPKRLVPIEGAAAAQHHVLAGEILAPEANEHVTRVVLDFLGPLAAEAAAQPATGTRRP